MDETWLQAHKDLGQENNKAIAIHEAWRGVYTVCDFHAIEFTFPPGGYGVVYEKG